jgi:hypothetical protein
LRVGLDTPLQEPGSEIACELFGALLQLSKRRRCRLGIFREEAVEDGIGMLVPLAA